MKTPNTFTVVFYLKKYKATADGKAPLYVRITVDGKRADISVRQNVDPALWDARKGVARGAKNEARNLNVMLERIRTTIINSYHEMILQKRPVNAEILKNIFLGSENKEYTLSKIIAYHNTTMKEVLAWGTLKNYFTTQKYLYKFLRERHKLSDIYLSSLTYKFITDFEHFLRTYKPVDHKKPLKNNGVMKHIERFRKMINMAVRLEWIEKDPFARYKQHFEKVERGFLTKEELACIEQKEFDIERLQMVQDLFVFSCYTGLCYMDVMQLKPFNVVIGSDGEYWINTTRQKTSEPVKIPMFKKAVNIIDKYRHDRRATAKGTLFPNVTNQIMNNYLKEIANSCGIKKRLTFHIARHTFATTIALSNGMPIESVSKMLGHTSISTTQIYAKVVEKKLGEDMRDLRRKLE